MTDDFNAGVEAAAKVMEDLDRSGWFASAIRARAKQAVNPSSSPTWRRADGIVNQRNVAHD